MRPLTAADVVRIWDQGQAWHPIDRALLLLAYALPEVPSDAFPALSVGQRNLALLKSRPANDRRPAGRVGQLPQVSGIP